MGHREILQMATLARLRGQYSPRTRRMPPHSPPVPCDVARDRQALLSQYDPIAPRRPEALRGIESVHLRPFRDIESALYPPSRIAGAEIRGAFVGFSVKRRGFLAHGAVKAMAAALTSEGEHHAA
jgi:hypothetical protein